MASSPLGMRLHNYAFVKGKKKQTNNTGQSIPKHLISSQHNSNIPSHMGFLITHHTTKLQLGQATPHSPFIFESGI